MKNIKWLLTFLLLISGLVQAQLPNTTFGHHEGNLGVRGLPTTNRNYGLFRLCGGTTPGTSWVDIETSRGVYNWSNFDSVMNIINVVGGKEVIYCPWKTPAWANPSRKVLTIPSVNGSMARFSNTVTFSGSGLTGYLEGQYIDVSGVTPSSFNGTGLGPIHIIGAGDSFTYPQTAADETGGATGGTITNTAGGQDEYPPDNMTDWTDMLTVLVTRFDGTHSICGGSGTAVCGRIKDVEIWNEPNTFWENKTGTNPHLDDLAQMMLTAYPIVHGVAGNVQMSPAPQGTSLGSPNSYLSKLFTRAGSVCGGVGNGHCMDVVAFHGYLGTQNDTPDASTITIVGQIKSDMSANGIGSLPIWDDEHSWGNERSCPIVASTGAARLSNVVTITCTVPTGYKVNEHVDIAGVSDGTFNGNNKTIISVPTATTFTYSQSAADATSGSGTASITNQPNPYPDQDLQAAWVARQAISEIASGVARSVFFMWSNTTFGTLWKREVGPTCIPGIAWEQVFDWLNGSTVPVAAPTLTGHLYSVDFTRPNGASARLLWRDSSNTDCAGGTLCTCSGATSCATTDQGGICTTATYTAPAQFTRWQDLSGNISNIVAGVVPVGIKPVMLTGDAPANAIELSGKGVGSGQGSIQ